jgi:ABC-type dipeptide/oligopeptide/nickel transport system permease component
MPPFWEAFYYLLCFKSELKVTPTATIITPQAKIMKVNAAPDILIPPYEDSSLINFLSIFLADISISLNKSND